MDDRDFIDCVERMRAHVLGEAPWHEAALTRLRAADWRSLDAQAVADKAVAASATIDETTPGGLRRLRIESERLEAEVAEEAAAEYARHEGSPSATPACPESARVIDIAALPHLAARAAEFRQKLEPEPPAREAATMARRFLGRLVGLKAYRFLSAIGYPATVPDHRSVCLVDRLLGLRGKAGSAEHESDFQQRMAAIARAAATTIPELDALAGAWCGAQPLRGFEAPCGTTPRCDACVIRHHCRHRAAKGTAAQPRSHPAREWPEGDRPREKLACGTPLSDAVLLAIILRTGTGRVNAVDLARRITGAFGTLPNLAAASVEDLKQIPGLGPAKAAEIRTAVELGRRLADRDADERDAQPQVQVSEDVFGRYRARFMGVTQEVFLLLTLSAKNRITRKIEVSKGTLNASIVHPRDVFNHALREAAHAVIFVHNHPSGDPSPSGEDRTLTRRLAEAGKLLGIPVLDHVIIGARTHCSFADQGELR
jgi:DNA repair protein RadC